MPRDCIRDGIEHIHSDERLEQVTDDAPLKRNPFRHGVVTGRQDHRHGRETFTNLRNEPFPAAPWQHQIAEDYGYRDVFHQSHCGFCIGGLENIAIHRSEPSGQQFPDAGFVIDDQHGHHGRPVFRTAGQLTIGVTTYLDGVGSPLEGRHGSTILLRIA